MNTYDGNDIQKANDARKLHILSGFSEFGNIEKGFKDKPNPQKNEEDTTNEKPSGHKPQPPGAKPATPSATDDVQNSNEEGGDTPVHEHAKNTPDEHLQSYLDNNPDGEHAHIAKQELDNRKNGVAGDGAEEGEIDYSNPEAVKQALANSENKDAIMALMLEDPTMTAATALKVYNASNLDNSAVHAKIDAVDAALNDLKAHTGHGADGDGPVSTQYSQDELEAMSDEELQGLIEDLGFEFEDREQAIAFILDSQEDDEANDDDDEGGFDAQQGDGDEEDDDEYSEDEDDDFDDDNDNYDDDEDADDEDEDDEPKKKPVKP